MLSTNCTFQTKAKKAVSDSDSDEEDVMELWWVLFISMRISRTWGTSWTLMVGRSLSFRISFFMLGDSFILTALWCRDNWWPVLTRGSHNPSLIAEIACSHLDNIRSHMDENIKERDIADFVKKSGNVRFDRQTISLFIYLILSHINDQVGQPWCSCSYCSCFVLRSLF